MSESRLVAERATEPHTDALAGERVTAVVCTYRGTAFLEEQVRSIQEQTRPPAEILVTDDGSGDGTVPLAVEVLAAGTVPYRVYTRDSPLGIAGNAFFGLQHARTPLVAFADQDDRWHPDKLERLVPLLADDASAWLAHSDAALVDEHGSPLGEGLFDSLEPSAREWRDYTGPEPWRQLLRRNFVTGATMLVRREPALAAGRAPAPWIHDEWLAVAAALHGAIRVTRAPLIDYRQHGANQIGQRRLGLGEKIARITGPGAARQQRKTQRAAALAGRVRALGASAEQETFVRRKAAFERARAALPAARPLRVAHVARRALAGQYETFARGLGDVARDLLQSHTDAATEPATD
ncbi:glycosyltransferase [Pseudoclavibacter chungangensis]|uniref:Glycosyltransferase n=1 Tax=Pseudoclavibacter chungangensis TaxID=587635 RepID=A0A7J5BZY2_9MICO|nr:glycosyltransferase [Pseudoclavibacter chungangensis]KAB1659473.1 glycosyltransferase [Pseudoclavibacter chungangensis]NYJ67670.1 hypothetical protein [Pseudoclavibacter chungangensis]